MKKKVSKNKKRNIFQKIFDLRYFFYDFVKFTGAPTAIPIIRVKRYYKAGKKPKGLYKGQYVIVSNHPTFIDPIILSLAFWKRRISFIATTDLFSSKLRRFFFNNVKMIPIDRENVKMETIKRVKNVLDSGHLILIFPGGHVLRNEDSAEYKPGAVMLALINKTPILPVYIKKRAKWWQTQKVMIGEKIDVEKYIESKIPTMEDIIKITTILQKEERVLAEILEKRISKKC